MSKKVRSLLLFLILLSVLLTSCTATNSDPFENDDKTKEDGDAEKDDPPEDGGFVQTPPPADFYGMTSLESIKKYGAFMFVDGLKYFDNIDGDKWYYYDVLPKENQIGKYTISSLYFREYPDGEPHLVCPDPLCTHSDENCPFFNRSIGNYIVFKENCMIFSEKDGDLLMYTVSENKFEKIAEDINNVRYKKYGSELYITYQRENENFGIDNYVCKILPDGKITHVYQLTDPDYVHTLGCEIYKEKYILYGTRDRANARLVLFDFMTGEKTTVIEHDYSAKVRPYYLYGDKTLLYRLELQDDSTEFWLADLSTGEKRMLTVVDKDGLMPSMHCLYSDKCIMYTAQRQTETDPLVVHFLFPETGEEEVYDVGKAAADAGITISLENFIYFLKKGAISFKAFISDEYMADTFEYDLKSGKLYCYDLPDEE